MDRQDFKSYSQVISLALVDYFDRYYRTQADPYLETREREELFVKQIVDSTYSWSLVPAAGDGLFLTVHTPSYSVETLFASWRLPPWTPIQPASGRHSHKGRKNGGFDFVKAAVGVFKA